MFRIFLIGFSMWISILGDLKVSVVFVMLDCVFRLFIVEFSIFGSRYGVLGFGEVGLLILRFILSLIFQLVCR